MNRRNFLRTAFQSVATAVALAYCPSILAPTKVVRRGSSAAYGWLVINAHGWYIVPRPFPIIRQPFPMGAVDRLTPPLVGIQPPDHKASPVRYLESLEVHE